MQARHREHPALAKITPPSGAAPLSRPRPLRAIGASGARLIWISGPPGAGKTMLALGFAAERELAPLWLRLDAGDADPASFFSHLWAAARRARASGRRTASPRRPPLSAEMLRGLASYARRYFPTLFAASEEPRLLVFEDAQELRGALDEIFAILADELPPQATLLISSRDPMPEALTRAVVSGCAHEIGADALCLARGSGPAHRSGLPPRPASRAPGSPQRCSPRSVRPSRRA